jgi:DNA-directed RNA polymerase specialized sigma24 family protein
VPPISPDQRPNFRNIITEIPIIPLSHSGLDSIPDSGIAYDHTDLVARRSQESMYEATGMTGDQRDAVIWELRRRHVTYARIARRVGCSVGAVQASLTRTAAKLSPATESDWDADLR